MTETIQLDSTLLSIARRLAEKRHDSFKHDNYEDSCYSDKNSYEVHLLGAKSEVAVSVKYGLLVDMKQRLEGDDFDFQAKYEDRMIDIDVKATTYKPPWLQVPKKKVRTDYFFATYLSSIEATEVELIGWASREQVEDADVIQSPAGGSHLNYRLWEDEMDALPSPTEVKAWVITALVTPKSENRRVNESAQIVLSVAKTVMVWFGNDFLVLIDIVLDCLLDVCLRDY